MQIFSPFIISLLSVWCLYEENLQLYSAQFISLWFYDLWLQIHSLIFSSRIYYVFIFIFKSLIFLCEVGHQLSFLPDGFPVVSTSSIKWAIFYPMIHNDDFITLSFPMCVWLSFYIFYSVPWMYVFVQQRHRGKSLPVQWLRLGAFTVWAQVQSPVGELRSHKPCSMAKRKCSCSVFLEILIVFQQSFNNFLAFLI